MICSNGFVVILLAVVIHSNGKTATSGLYVLLRAGNVQRPWQETQVFGVQDPRYIRFVSELPKTVTGKAQKFAMREAMMRELGVREARTA